ncbi:cytochrome b562 [Luteolibacter arcticus]|uniref:Cytochrome b562 n=1 Tax=Luteolibacter arcticus TaxID=1581411 RepID=A0ABT3GLT6_9BACT|nr:cytochrome b562 [Luteolibacter arcticus]MCW1924488.1 cytochrome b562 [Luteolibacter arcticus]
MKKLIFPALLLASALMLPTPLRADEDTPLAKEMEKVDEAFKGFRRETDPVKGAKAAREAQDAVLKTVALVPAMIEKMPAGEAKDKAIAAYRTQMGQLFVIFCEVESAFIAKDLPAVTKLVESVKGSKKKGHDEFMEEEEE